MTPEQFRTLALSFPGAEERSHNNHPDFRVAGKVFATLGYPDSTRAMVKLSAQQQAEFMHDHPTVFSPAAGAWGRQGCTIVCLSKAKRAVMQPAVAAAWQNLSSAADRLGGPKKARKAER